MFRRCHVCHTPLPANGTLEELPVGRRFAVDPQRGRLWAVCERCAGWTLAPFDSRWEAVEALDRLAETRARLLVRGENVSLLQSGDLQIIRVGNAPLREEAWWRYGRELIARRAQLIWSFGLYFLFARRRRFGPAAWSGSAQCATCGSALQMIPFRRAGDLIAYAGDDGLELRLRCPQCRDTSADAGYRLSGVAADHLLRRVLAYRHHGGASARRVADATRLIENIGSPEKMITGLARKQLRLRALPETYAYSLEIALNDETERRVLQLEFAELEERWREEEEIAAIADGELTGI